MYTALQLRWLMCIEIMYIWLCSFFPDELLQHMKWYVGKSMIYDSHTKSLRKKQFYLEWGAQSFQMLTEFVSNQHSMDIQCHDIYIQDT